MTIIENCRILVSPKTLLTIKLKEAFEYCEVNSVVNGSTECDATGSIPHLSPNIINVQNYKLK